MYSDRALRGVVLCSFAWFSATAQANANISKQLGREHYPNYATKETRIVGGEVVSKLVFPWMVAIVNPRRTLKGGAVLINEAYVMTAAHVVSGCKAADIRLLMGCYNIVVGDWASVLTPIDINVHPEYNSPTVGKNDIALLQLPQNVKYSLSVRQACLPLRPDDDTQEGDRITVIGWGRTSNDANGRMSPTLLQVTQPVLDGKPCQTKYGPMYFATGMICCGVRLSGQDSCSGDSGGPSMRKGPSGSWTVVGLISWGTGCAQSEYPAVYTRVSYYVPWIMEYVDRDQLSKGCENTTDAVEDNEV